MYYLGINLFTITLFLVLDAWFCATENLESQIKTAYTLNFIKFTTWPNGGTEDNRVKLCVVGDDVLHGMPSALDERQAGAQKLRVCNRFITQGAQAYTPPWRNAKSCLLANLPGRKRYPSAKLSPASPC